MKLYENVSILGLLWATVPIQCSATDVKDNYICTLDKSTK